MLNGKGVSSGIAIGRALILNNLEYTIEQKEITNIDNEVNRYINAVNEAKNELKDLSLKTREKMGDEKAEIFEAHLMILEDPELIEKTINFIKEQKVNAEFAFNEITNKHIKLFESLEDEYMKERASDIKDVSKRVFQKLININKVDLSSLAEEVIVVTHDLSPSDTATMNKNMVLGVLANVGGKTSHTAIMARTLEIPAVLGLTNVTDLVHDNDLIVLDGESGRVYINPDETIINEYQNKKVAYMNFMKELKAFIGKPSQTPDGHVVELAGNIGTPNDLESLFRNDAEGVGLFRTEFLYMNRDSLPSEEVQFESYKKVLQGMGNKPVVIRTLDIGGDKKLPYLNIEEEMNPFLGYRAIRLCLDQVELFKTQLRALLRSSIYGNLKIMFPMISNLNEINEAKRILEEVKTELEQENIAYAKEIQVGMMIEVPSAAIYSDVFAKYVDFFSIGTNDLIQYTFAVDRMNEKLQPLYNPFDPAFLRLVKMVIDHGHQNGIWVGMCGEVAGDVRLIPILLGMGLNEFSMSPNSILKARKLISKLKKSDASILLSKIMQLENATIIEQECKQFIDQYK